MAAIMFTDIVGYTALMGSDEDKAFQILDKNTEIHNKLLAEHNGTLIKAIGDGMLISFNLASDAVRCAIALQNECKNQEISLKIGIHQGEVVFADADVFGDGVNIASRLQENAEAGSIHISDKVYSDVKNQSSISTAYVGERTFKNVDEPIRLYKVLIGGENEESFSTSETKKNDGKIKYYVLAVVVIAILSILIWNFLPKQQTKKLEKSIAVLPLEYLSEDPSKQYLAAGVLDAITGHLSKIEGLRVIPRTSVVQYRKSEKTITEIGQELNVSYLLEGSFLMQGNQVRLNIQLVTAEGEDHIWFEEYDREWSDIFRVQSEVAQSIAGEVQIVLSPEEKEKIASSSTDNAEAYDLYLLANWQSADDVKRSIILLEKAIELDPEFADAYALLGWLKSQFWWFGQSELKSAEEAFNTGKPYYEKALELEPDNVTTLSRMQASFLLYKWDFKKADSLYQVIGQLDPYGKPYHFLFPLGRFKEGLLQMELKMSKDPFSVHDIDKIICYYFNDMEEEALKVIEATPKNVDPHVDMAIVRVYLFMGKYDEALAVLDQFFEIHKDDFTNASWPLGFLGVANYHRGKLDETNEILEVLKKRSEESSAGSPSYCITMIYAQMGKIDLAFKWLEKAYQDREVEMYWLKVVPLFEPLHGDPRWQEMLDKVGFPD